MNPKDYPLLNKFVEQKEKFIGKKMIDQGMGMTIETIITDIVLKQNGDDSVWFEFEGQDFSCGFDVKFGSFCSENDGYTEFNRTYSGSFYIEGLIV